MVGANDGWIWANGPFSVRGVYRRLRTHHVEDPVILRACRSVWKQKIPPKVMIFAWTLTRKRTMAHVRRQRFYPAEPFVCVVCMDGEEDIEHLFFECRVARVVWASQGLSEVTSSLVFWNTMPRRIRGQEKERGRRFAVLWAIWLHHREVVFEGRAVSVDSVVHDVEKLIYFWFDHG